MGLITHSGSGLVTHVGGSLSPHAPPPPTGSWISLADAKVRLGVTGTAQDIEVQAAIDAALEIIEVYLDRKLLYEVDQELFYDVQGHTISLRRYPVNSITLSSRAFKKLDKQKGLIHFNGGILEHEVTVDYEGGYQVIPAPILLALLSTLDNVWLHIDSTSVAPISSSEVKAMSIPDVGRIEYNVASQASDGGDDDGFAKFFGQFIGMLQFYRRKSC